MVISRVLKLRLLVPTIHLEAFPENIDSVQPLFFGYPKGRQLRLCSASISAASVGPKSA